MKKKKSTLKIPYHYRTSAKTPTGVLLRRLRNERRKKKGELDTITHLVDWLRKRGRRVQLTQDERQKLIDAYGRAQTGKIGFLPLMQSLPAGFQILRIARLIVTLLPGISINLTERDVRIINKSPTYFGPETMWVRDWEKERRRNARFLGLTVNPKTGKVSL